MIYQWINMRYISLILETLNVLIDICWIAIVGYIVYHIEDYMIQLICIIEALR